MRINGPLHFTIWILFPIMNKLQNPGVYSGASFLYCTAADYLKIKEVNYIVIEGNIGAGKTSLALMLAREMKARQFLSSFQKILFCLSFTGNPINMPFPLNFPFWQNVTDNTKRNL